MNGRGETEGGEGWRMGRAGHGRQPGEASDGTGRLAQPSAVGWA
jgi:hypothetical protein